MSSNRSLSPWELAVCDALSPLGFIYFPHEKGSGYWYNKRHGLYLTNDLSLTMRGLGTRRWTLKLVEGLIVGEMWFPDRKRTPETTADDIEKKIQRLFDKTGWKNLPEWRKIDYGSL